MEKARLEGDDATGSGVPGMKITEVVEEDDVKEEETNVAIVKPTSVQKKTKAQKNKGLKLLAEVWIPCFLAIHDSGLISPFRSVHLQTKLQIGGYWLRSRSQKA